MTQTLREKAERINNGNDTDGDVRRGFVGDAVDLAEAYLAEHPADEDEPIDEAWLVSIGAHVGETCVSFQVQHSPRGGEKTLSVVMHNGRWTLYLTDEDEDQDWWPLPVMKTRGAVLRLLSALGVQVTKKE